MVWRDANLITASNTPILIDGVTGLTGLIGAGSDPTSGALLTGGIEVTNMHAGFTLSGFNITDDRETSTVWFHDNSGTLNIENLEIQNVDESGFGITVGNQTGAVNLYAVNIHNSGGEGASLYVTGAVTITNSAFDANGGTLGNTNGLTVNATGAVTLNSVSASNNTRGDGARITSQTGVTVRNSTFFFVGVFVTSRLPGIPAVTASCWITTPAPAPFR